MTRAALVLLVAAFAAPAWAQKPQPTFPMNQSYKVISISGFDVQNKGLSLTLTRAADGVRGAGNAGCNSWSAVALVRDDQIDFTNIITTKKMCGKAEMKAEDAFLTSIRSAKRWHVDGDKLIIEGDAARLMLKPGVATLKPEKPPKQKKPQRRQPR